MRHLLLLSLLLFQFKSFSQKSIDLVNVYSRISPNNPVDNSNTTRNFNMFVFDAKLPIVLNENNVLITGIEYQQNTINTSGNLSNLIQKYAFASSTLQIGLQHDWNDQSKILLMSFTRLNTDYYNVNKTHFQLGGLALGTSKRSETFAWKYGLYYNGEFFSPMLVPLFGFNWDINDKWRLKTAIPVNFELRYHPNSKLNAGLRFDGVNGSYRALPVPTSASNANHYIDKADNNLWLFSEFNLGKNVWFHIKAGHSVMRKYRIYENNEKLALKVGPANIGKSRPESINLLKNGWSFEFRFIYRLPID